MDSVKQTQAVELHEGTRAAIESLHEETRALMGTYAMDVVEGVGELLESRGSTIDAAHLVEIGVARLDLAEFDGALRRGEGVEAGDVRALVGKVDDLLRRVENAIIAGARPVAKCAFVGAGLIVHGLAWANGLDALDPFIADGVVSTLQSISPLI